VDSPGESLALNRDSALYKDNHWRSKCPHHQMEGEVPPSMDWWVPVSCLTLHFLASMLRSHNVRKTKGHFPPRQWSPFPCFIFFSWSPVQWQKLSFGANLASP
jgi:hypothetical protein